MLYSTAVTTYIMITLHDKLNEYTTFQQKLSFCKGLLSISCIAHRALMFPEDI